MQIVLVVYDAVVLHVLAVLAAQWSWFVHVHFVSSFSTEGAVVPVGQVAHEAASEKVTSGLDMYLPAGQQPRRALLPVKTFDKVDHLPPHNVLLNPLW